MVLCKVSQKRLGFICEQIQDFGKGDGGAGSCTAGVAAPQLQASPTLLAGCVAEAAVGTFF